MILIFKTSVQNPDEAERLKPRLKAILPEDTKWNFDLEDCDKILRVECSIDLRKSIILFLQGKGYFCEELED